MSSTDLASIIMSVITLATLIAQGVYMLIKLNKKENALVTKNQWELINKLINDLLNEQKKIREDLSKMKSDITKIQTEIKNIQSTMEE